EVMFDLGLVREKLGESQKSLDLLKQSVELWGTTGSPPNPLMLSGLAAGQESAGQLAEALAGQKRALAAVGDSGGNAQYEWLIQGRLGHVERAMGLKLEALDEYQKAVHSIEILRASALNTESGRALGMAARQSVFGETADLLYDLHREAEALELAERGRARA